VVGESDGVFDHAAVETMRGWRRFEVKTDFGIASVWAK
jgi:hypothetical protein